MNIENDDVDLRKFLKFVFVFFGLLGRRCLIVGFV